MTRRRLKTGDPTYGQTWDDDNRLKTVTVNPTPLALRGLRGQTTTFTCDDNGALVKKVAGGVTTAYVGSHYEKQGSTVVKYYLFGGQRVALNKGGVLYYLAGDHLGTTSVVLCGQAAGCGGIPLGGKVAESRHHPYGTIRWSSGTFPTDYRFTGQRLDGYIKLYLMAARPYDPELGRWISADAVCPTSTDYSQFSLALTVSYAETSVLTQLSDANRQGGVSSESAGLLVPENPQLCNRFSYVANNPLGYRDPSGHRPKPPEWSQRFAKLLSGVATILDTVAWSVSLGGAALEVVGFTVGIPVTLGEEPLTGLGSVLLYNAALNPIENQLSAGSFLCTWGADWLSGASYVNSDPLALAIGQDSAISFAGVVVGNGLPLTPEAITDLVANSAVLYYDYGRLLEQIPTGFEIRIVGMTEDGLSILGIVPIADQ